MKKNYIGFVNDHSGSMESLAISAMNDFNSNIKQIRDSATEHLLDTIVSVVSFGAKGGSDIEKEIIISNPHVLNPKTNWKAEGGTPLYDAIAVLIKLFKSLPDSNDSEVSFLLMITTDGQDEHSRKYNENSLKSLIQTLDDRWTIVCRVPNKYSKEIETIGIPKGNIQVWDTTNKGLKESSDKTKQAIGTYFTQRSQGKRSSNTFYTNVSNGVVELPPVHGNTKPTPSPIPKANKGPMTFSTRKLARDFAKANNMKVYDSNITGLNTTHRWYVV